MKSETISKLAAALSKAQKEVGAAKKDSQNPYFKSKYADLESVWQACRDVLSKYELAIVQCPQIVDQQICLETMLLHSSGEWIKSCMPLMLTKQDPQTVGSAMTYARRYALAAMVGIVQSDDDGEKAMEPVRAPKKKEKPINPAEVKSQILKEIEVENAEYLEEYLKFVEKKVQKPMREVVDGWLENAEPFKAHYQKWCEKKLIEKNKDESYQEEKEQNSLFVSYS